MSLEVLGIHLHENFEGQGKIISINGNLKEELLLIEANDQLLWGVKLLAQKTL